MSNNDIIKISKESFQAAQRMVERVMVDPKYNKGNSVYAVYAIKKQISIKPLNQTILCFNRRGFCECGNEVVEPDKFCSHCGKALDWELPKEDECSGGLDWDDIVE